MPDVNNPTISQVETTEGNIYDIEDTQAREQIKDLQGQKHYLGTVTADSVNKPENDAAITPVTVTRDGETSTVTPNAGQYVIYGEGEYLASDDGKWHKFGDHSGLGTLATKASVTGTVKPKGTVTLPGLKADPMTATGSVDIPDSASTPAFKGTPDQEVSVSGTPKADVSISAAAVPADGTATYTPDGKVELTPTTAAVKEVKGVGTLPTLKTTVENGVLKFNFDQGTLPSTKDTDVLTGASAKFTGTGTMLNAKYTGQDSTFTGKFTATGTVDPITLTKKAVDISVSGTPIVSYDGEPGFEGKEETIESK